MYIPTQEIKDIQETLDKIACIYQNTGFLMHFIFADQEFKPLENFVKDEY